MPHRLAVTVVLAGVLLLGSTGCGDDDDDRPASGASSVTKLVERGREQLQAGRTDTARKTFRKALGLDPDNAFAHYNLGLIAQRSGDEATAMRQYDAALAARPTFGSALYNKAMLTEPGNLSAAVKLYRKAVTADPRFAPAHMRLGFALLHLGHKAAGEKELAAGVKLDPSMADVQAPSYG